MERNATYKGKLNRTTIEDMGINLVVIRQRSN